MVGHYLPCFYCTSVKNVSNVSCLQFLQCDVMSFLTMLHLYSFSVAEQFSHSVISPSTFLYVIFFTVSLRRYNYIPYLSYFTPHSFSCHVTLCDISFFCDIFFPIILCTCQAGENSTVDWLTNILLFLLPRPTRIRTLKRKGEVKHKNRRLLF